MLTFLIEMNFSGCQEEAIVNSQSCWCLRTLILFSFWDMEPSTQFMEKLYIFLCALKYSGVLFVCLLWHFSLYYRYFTILFMFLNKINASIFASLLHANFLSISWTQIQCKSCKELLSWSRGRWLNCKTLGKQTWGTWVQIPIYHIKDRHASIYL